MTNQTIKRIQYGPEDFVTGTTCDPCGAAIIAFRKAVDVNEDNGEETVCDRCFADPAYDWQSLKSCKRCGQEQTGMLELCDKCRTAPATEQAHSIQIAPDGTITTLHADAIASVVAATGDATVARASHVEPDGLRWSVAKADGTDTGKRFDTRADALAWERDNWRDLCGCHE